MQEQKEYKTIETGWSQLAAELNKLSADGWNVIGFSAGGPAGYQTFALLERPLKK